MIKRYYVWCDHSYSIKPKVCTRYSQDQLFLVLSRNMSCIFGLTPPQMPSLCVTVSSQHAVVKVYSTWYTILRKLEPFIIRMLLRHISEHVSGNEGLGMWFSKPQNSVFTHWKRLRILHLYLSWGHNLGLRTCRAPLKDVLKWYCPVQGH